MKHLFLAILTVVTLLFAQPLAAATNQVFNDEQKKAIEDIVRDYITSHPDAIFEAYLKPQPNKYEPIKVEQPIVSDENYVRLLKNPGNIVMGNPNGDVTVVEFFDYRCGYCKSAISTVKAFLEQDKRTKFIFVEYPILSRESVLAASGAMAANKQGKYLGMHFALMETIYDLNLPNILRMAEANKLDVEKLKTDMQSAELGSALQSNGQIGMELGITGTPTFLIGKKIYKGVLSLDKLKGLVAAERGIVSAKK